ncbi:MAG: isoleucine--tRNA ligase [Cyclobacteriaceae bacterium]|nr:isoleucine--tRNA ligase [Cyclobacteriaceae bacterium]
MAKTYKEPANLNYAQLASDILNFWKSEKIFEQSVANREGAPTFTFYEGPPSANGTPGIHHVMARTIKDIFCRFKTLQGYQVKRKGGWDTHGLPVELQVEKQLGITKDDIGKKISIEEYNRKCKETVMMYKDQWDDLTMKMGYWVDLDDPYITYDSNYIETLWWILKQFYTKGLLYKGYTIQPFSPAAGTGLSSHELNLPGTYKTVKDTSVVAQFKVKRDAKSEFLYTPLEGGLRGVFILAWTTTPWTLPSNTALAVGEKIQYVQVNTFNTYTHQPVSVILAKDLVQKYFSEKGKDLDLQTYKPGDKVIPYKVVQEFTGKQVVGVSYEQLMPYIQPLYDADKAFKVVAGDFVTTEDGTGVVHTSPTFGADDFRVAKQYGIPPLTVKDENGNEVPTVDRKGKFVNEIGSKLKEGVERYKIKSHKPLTETDFYVKNYTDEDESHPDYKSTDVIISIILKEENKAFKVEKYEHTYPHCWRTDKPVLYYPLDSWFIKTTALKERMAELNKTINWKPESTGTGRFGNWLENLVDWNLSRSRYWGTPLPIWRTKDGKEEKCIGSLVELQEEIEKAKKAGVYTPSISFEGGTSISHSKGGLRKVFDLHRPYVDEIVLVSPSGKPMYREPDLIDVWFDSGAMPYAQWGLNHELLKKGDPMPFNDGWKGAYPADFISEGVDQTRGWFFTLHAIAVLLYDSIAFKNVISTGLLLDKDGNKMSKRLGNVINPFETLEQFGPDLVRWYMVENAPPWENLKFDLNGVVEVQRRFFGTLVNTYSFFALYANIDGFVKDEVNNVPFEKLTHLDKWIISKLQSLITEVTEAYTDYEPTRAARAIQEFVNDHLSNWYVRLNRKRFWQPNLRGELSEDKKAAYETLYQCLMVTAQLMSPIAPFFADWLYKNLSDNIRDKARAGNTPLRQVSVHLTDLVNPELAHRNMDLEISMDYAQRICSLVHSLRKNSRIKVRTPLQKILLPVLDPRFAERIRSVEEIIKAEVNIKHIEYIDDTTGLVTKKAKPNFAKLGRQYGPRMKEVAAVINSFTQADIQQIEKQGALLKEGFNLVLDDVLISSEDIPGWSVATDNDLTVALDITLTDELKREGIARDFVNRVQNLRKDMGFAVLDKITIEVERNGETVASALTQYSDYIRTETQAIRLELKDQIPDAAEVDMDDFKLNVKISLIR